MTLAFRKLHPHFVAEVSGIDLRQVHDQVTLDKIRAALDEYAVLVFHNQPLSNSEQLSFAQRFDGTVNTENTTASIIGKNRFGYDGFNDISNVDGNGEIRASDDRVRLKKLTNRLWHTDASIINPPGRYSMLSARTIPPVSADTEFADMRAAYDALEADMKTMLDGLRVYHSATYNKEILGFEFSQEEKDRFKGTVHPLVRTIPPVQRYSLYLSAHASHIVDWHVPDGRLLIRDLTEHATQQQFAYRHEWCVEDFVIWDNRATMHRGRRFDELKYRRELVRVTTLDIM